MNEEQEKEFWGGLPDFIAIVGFVAFGMLIAKVIYENPNFLCV